MSKIVVLWSCLLCLVACRDDQSASKAGLFESTAVLQIHPTGTEAAKVDYERELLLCKSEEVLSAAAESLGLTAAAIEHLELKALAEESQIEVTVGHSNQETARQLASAIASSYLTARGRREKQAASDRQAALTGELEAEEKDLDLQMAKFEELLNQEVKSAELQTLESDRITYEKAKAALEEAEE